MSTKRVDISIMESIYIIAGAIVLLATVYYYLTSLYGYWEKQGVPTIKGAIPGIGNIGPMLLMRKNFGDLYQDFYNQTPAHSMVGFYTMREPALLLKDPELVKTVVQGNFSNFVNNEVSVDPELDSLMYANPFFLKDETWKDTRKQLTSGFSSSKLKSSCITVENVCGKLANFLKQKITEENDGVEMEMKALCSRYTAEFVATSAFGIEGGCLKDENEGTFLEMSKKVFDPTFAKGVGQLIVLFIPGLRKLLKVSFVPPSVEKFFTNLVSDVLKYRESEDVQGKDFLQMLIDLKKSGTTDHAFGTKFNESTITSHAFGYLIDAYETTSLTLTLLSYSIAKYPKVQQQVREETEGAIKKHGGLTYDALQEMPYLDKVIQESLRLNPTLGALVRICTTETDLVGSDGIKCHVNKGTSVIIPVAGLQMDPQYWPDPEKFDPERFSEENKQNRHKFLWLSFGGGPRVCVGMKMAVILMKAAITTILRDYSMDISPRTAEPLQMNPYYFMSSVVGGMWIKIKRL